MVRGGPADPGSATGSGLYVGLMSGTSLDGVDAALCAWTQDGSLQLVETHYQPYPEQLRSSLEVLCAPGPGELDLAGICGILLAREYATATKALLAAAKTASDDVQAIGCHGQTIRHRPADGFSIQAVSPAYVAELTGIDVVADFRNRDLAAGGQGAPLVPAFHASVFGADGEHRVVVNIGGFANITDLAPEGRINGFDTGPGNSLLDLWIHRHVGRRYDDKGAWAASGQVLPDLLDRMLAEPYFTAPPPKSTGREHFDASWLDHCLSGQEQPADVQATIATLTVETVARSINSHCRGASLVMVCGGGARNDDLMQRLSVRLAPAPVRSTADFGLDPEWVEAVAFAWLARQWMLRRPGNVPAVTGARGPRVLGACYPA